MLLHRVIEILRRRPLYRYLAAALFFPLLNGGLSLAARYTLPFFMDSIFTAVSAALLGLWPGMITAVLTNLFHEAIQGFPGIHLPFSLCGMATALVVWAWSRSQRGSAAFSWALCTVAVALSNSLLGALIAIFVFGGGTGVNIDNIVSGFSLVTDSLFTAAFLARLLINLVDKAVAVIPALAFARSFPPKGSPPNRPIGEGGSQG